MADIKANNSDGPITIPNNGSATLTWSAANAASCTLADVTYCVDCNPDYQITGTPVSVNVFGSKIVTLVYGQHTPKEGYIFSCKDSSGNTIGDSVLINVSQVNAPKIEIKANGSVNSLTLLTLAPVNLSWSSTDAATCVASGNWSGSKNISGSETVTLPPNKVSADYSLSCTGPTGTATSSVKVSITQATFVFTTPGSGLATEAPVSGTGSTTTNTNSSSAPFLAKCLGDSISTFHCPTGYTNATIDYSSNYGIPECVCSSLTVSPPDSIVCLDTACPYGYSASLSCNYGSQSKCGWHSIPFHAFDCICKKWRT